MDLDKCKVYFLDNQEKRFEEKDKRGIEALVQEVFFELHKVIEFDFLHVLFFYDKEEACLGHGVNQRSLGENVLCVALDSEKETSFLLGGVRRAVIQEAAHSIRAQRLGSGEVFGGGLLQSFIVEGIAGHFVSKVLRIEKPEWFNPLKNVTDVLSLAEKEFDGKYCNSNKWFFGLDKDVPLWSGFALGYYIVDNYLKNSNKDIFDIFDISSEEIYEKSKQ